MGLLQEDWIINRLHQSSPSSILSLLCKSLSELLLDMLPDLLLMGDKPISSRPELLLLLLLKRELIGQLSSDTDLLIKFVHLLFLVLKDLLMSLEHGLISL